MTITAAMEYPQYDPTIANTPLSDDELELRLYPPVAKDAERPLPDPATLDIELRKTGVTLRLLHIGP